MEGYKLLGSLIVGSVGVYFLVRGKKIGDSRMILGGAVLVILSYFLFA